MSVLLFAVLTPRMLLYRTRWAFEVAHQLWLIKFRKIESQNEH